MRRIRTKRVNEPSSRADGVRYSRELAANPEATEELFGMAPRRTLTLVYSAKDEECNQAEALKIYLERQLGGDAD